MTGPPEAGHPRPLPLRPRPVTGEGAASYIRRLARANHLRPGYLRRYLRDPREEGTIRLDWLASLSGRPLQVLEYALAGPAAGTVLPGTCARPISRDCSRSSTKTLATRAYPSGHWPTGTVSTGGQYARRWTHPSPRPARSPKRTPPGNFGQDTTAHAARKMMIKPVRRPGTAGGHQTPPAARWAPAAAVIRRATSGPRGA